MKLKKNEDQSVDTLPFLRIGNKTPMEGVTETKFGAETKERSIYRLPYPGIHSIISLQKLTPLHTLARFCWKDPDIAVSCETTPRPSKHISSQSSIGWFTGPPVEELEKIPKELKGSPTLWVDQRHELTSTSELLTLAACVSKDGLVGHHWKERPIGLANFICPSTGERQGQKVGVGG